MQSIKNILMTTCIVIFTITIFAMDMDNIKEKAAALTLIKQSSPETDASSAEVSIDKSEDQSSQTKPKEYLFVYENGTENGIWVDKEIVTDNSKVIKSMLEESNVDSSTDEAKKIPLNFPLDIIKLTFNLLKDKIKKINKLSLEQIIDTANLFNYLDAPSQKLQVLLVLIKKNIDANQDYDSLKLLNPDLQKLLLVQPTINCLKNLIIKKYLKDRKKPLVGHPIDVNAIAFNADGTKFVSGGSGHEKTLIVWDISDPENITSQVIKDIPQGDILSVAFSPDNTKIAAGYDNAQNNLILCDISNPNKITPRPLAGHPAAVYTVAFSPDSTQLLSGCEGNANNLILWNITDLNNITHQTINGSSGTVLSVAFNPVNNKQFVSGCSNDNNENNLIIWDITDLNNITHHAVKECSSAVFSVAFDSDGKQIVTGGDHNNTKSNLIIWNIADPNAITSEQLIGHQRRVRSVMFNNDNTKIISGSLDKAPNNLILWDINDSKNITHQKLSGHTQGVISVAFSPDNKYMLSGSSEMKDNLILWTFVTNKEEQLLNNLSSYNVDQIRLIYQACLQEKINLEEDSDEYKIFESLPQDMQDLLRNLFIQKTGLLSSVWQALTQREM